MAWQNCNFRGIDLSSLSIGYARGMSKRWKLDSIMHSEGDSAQRALEAVAATYPGPIAQVLVQFQLTAALFRRIRLMRSTKKTPSC